MQLHSKMRYIAAQFDRYLTNNLWQKNAAVANQMAKKLSAALKRFPEVTITHPVTANGVFAILPSQIIPRLQKHYHFHYWNYEINEVRLMCSWDTTEEDINGFISKLDDELKKG